MKFFKYSLIAAIALSGALTACSDDDDYVPGSASPGVFFPEGTATAYSLESGENSITVSVDRFGVSTAAADYALVSSQEANLFTVPASVHFDADKNQSSITILCDAENMEYGKPYTLSIGFGEGVDVSVYGITQLDMTITRPEPWVTVGTALYRDDFVQSIWDLKTPIGFYELELQENETRPGLYRLVNPYGPETPWSGLQIADYTDSYLMFDASNPDKVFMYNFYTGIDIQGYGNILCGCLAYAALANGETPDDALYGKLKDGIVTFPNANSLVVQDNDGAVYANTHNNFAILFPGVELSDYSLALEYGGMFTSVEGEKSLIVNVDLGADVTSAKLAAVIANSGDEAVELVSTDAVESTEISASGEYKLSITDGGVYYVVLVGYANGEIIGSANTRVKVDAAGGGDENEWEDFGTGVIWDGWIAACFTYGDDKTYEDFPWEFPVQRSKNNPGLIRLVGPWTQPGENIIAYNQFNALSATEYIVVDVTNPECVLIEPQFSGLVWNQVTPTFPYVGKEWYICNLGGFRAADGMSAEDIIAAGENDVLDDEGYIYIADPLFGYDGEIGYQWTSKPASQLYIEGFDASASAPAKVGAKTKRALSRIASKFYAPVKKDRRVATDKSIRPIEIK